MNFGNPLSKDSSDLLCLPCRKKDIIPLKTKDQRKTLPPWINLFLPAFPASPKTWCSIKKSSSDSKNTNKKAKYEKFDLLQFPVKKIFVHFHSISYFATSVKKKKVFKGFFLSRLWIFFLEESGAEEKVYFGRSISKDAWDPKESPNTDISNNITTTDK